MGNEQIKQRETERLGFMLNRDGLEGALKFARQGYLVYKKALAREHGRIKSGYGRAYRRNLVNSMIVFRRFLRNTVL